MSPTVLIKYEVMAAAESAKNSVEALKSDLTRLHEQVASLLGHVATLESEASRLRGEKQQLENERTRLEGANWALQFELRGWRQQVERLARQAYEARQDREAMQELNRQLQAHLRETKHVLDELDAKHRLDDLEKSVKGIYQSRIWRSLVALSAPLEKLFGPRGR
jgi:chromosome segregation ATPase